MLTESPIGESGAPWPAPAGMVPVAQRPPVPWVWLGNHVDRFGDESPAGMPLPDLTSHLSVIGTTNAGKSTFLHNLALQVFGHGGIVVVIEPHGDLVKSILGALPADQAGAVTHLDFAAPDPVQINMATAGLAYERGVAVEMAMDAIRVMEESSWEGATRMREILEHTLHLMLARYGPQASLLHTYLFLAQNDASAQGKWLDRIPNHAGHSRDYWKSLLEEIRHNPRLSYLDIMQYPLRRLSGFLTRQYLRHALALPLLSPTRALKLEALLNSPTRQLLLVPLHEGLGEGGGKRVLATLLIRLISRLFLARSGLDRSARRPTLIILDEFASLAGSEVGRIVGQLLAEARKYGAAICLATQSAAQIPHDVRVNLDSNVNSRIALRVASERDGQWAAETLALPGLRPAHLLRLEPWSGYVRAMVNGQPQPTTVLQMLPPRPFPAGYGQQFVPSRREGPRFDELDYYAALVERAPEEALATLTLLSPESFHDLVAQQEALSGWQAEWLLTHPDFEPEPTLRLPLLTQARHGLPWWLLEAHYRRLRYVG